MNGTNPLKGPESNRTKFILTIIIILSIISSAVAGIVKAKQVHKLDDTLNSSEVSQDQLAQLKQEVEQITAKKEELERQK